MAKDHVPAIPYSGPAPQPVRKINLGNLEESDGVAEIHQAIQVDPEDLTPGTPPLPPTLTTRQGPSDPNLVQELAELKQSVGNLTNALGAQRADYESRLEEMRLNQEMSQLLGRQYVPELPAGVDPEQEIKAKDLLPIFTNFGNSMEAALLRRTWDVTPEEEQAVLQANPQFQSLAEPHRSQFIQRAVSLRRARTAPPTANGHRASSPAPQRQTQPARPTVPLVEHGFPPGTQGDLSQPSALAAANAEYEAALKIKDKKERFRAMKAAFQKAQAASGLTPDAMIGSTFRSS